MSEIIPNVEKDLNVKIIDIMKESYYTDRITMILEGLESILRDYSGFISHEQREKIERI